MNPPVPLSQRLRPGVEAAPWVIEEIRKLESRLAVQRGALSEEEIDACVARADYEAAAGTRRRTPYIHHLVRAIAEHLQGVAR